MVKSFFAYSDFDYANIEYESQKPHFERKAAMANGSGHDPKPPTSPKSQPKGQETSTSSSNTKSAEAKKK